MKNLYRSLSILLLTLMSVLLLGGCSDNPSRVMGTPTQITTSSSGLTLSVTTSPTPLNTKAEVTSITSVAVSNEPTQTSIVPPTLSGTTITPMPPPADTVIAMQNPSSAPCTNPRLDEALQVQTPNLDKLPHVNGIIKLPLLNQTLCSAQPPPLIKANYGSNNSPRIGIQIGHYQIERLPEDLSSLRGQTGGSGGGVREVDVNQDVAKRVAAILTARGATVDILPATVPDGYTADAFIAIHADASSAGNPHGFKLARSRFSAIPVTDDSLLNSIYKTYGESTGLPTDSSITRNMTGYYAFNARNRLHAVSKITPSAIIEMGFLTNASDRAFMTGHPDTAAQGIANGIWNFVVSRPALDKREKPQSQTSAIEAQRENTPIYDSTNTIIAYVSKGQLFEYFDSSGTNYSVFLPLLRKRGFIHKSDAVTTIIPR